MTDEVKIVFKKDKDKNLLRHLKSYTHNNLRMLNKNPETGKNGAME